LALDLVAVVERLEGPVVGVGHSSGGAALARTEILRPGTFERLVLIEPIIFPGPYERREIPRAVGAERRRRSFRSRDAAWERFATGPFKAWDRRVLDQYVEHGFIETDEGWTLRCDPGVEAEIYREGSNVDTWEYLDTIRCPVRIVCGSDSDTHQPPYLDELTDRFPNAHLVVLDGVGHLAPMEAPERIAETIR
jgi:pimeloyl-ACP methyl ester carboxylesterase